MDLIMLEKSGYAEIKESWSKQTIEKCSSTQPFAHSFFSNRMNEGI